MSFELGKVEQLIKSEVIEIHDRLTLDAANSEDPISPPGIRDHGLLESAIQRQNVGFGERLKYDDPISNAATLCYGICCNHALHNGNKRTALVSLMCHLDKNGYTFTDRASQDVLYSFMLKVAGHKFYTKKDKAKGVDQSDAEVKAMTDWIRRKTRRIQKSERSLSFGEFERILRDFGIYFENPKNSTVDLVRYKEVTKKGKFWQAPKTETVKEKVANIPYFPNRTVGKKLVRSVRRQANLAHEDGVDSTLFYGNETPPDEFIQKYKSVLRRLAKT